MIFNWFAKRKADRDLLNGFKDSVARTIFQYNSLKFERFSERLNDSAELIKTLRENGPYGEGSADAICLIKRLVDDAYKAGAKTQETKDEQQIDG